MHTQLQSPVQCVKHNYSLLRLYRRCIWNFDARLHAFTCFCAFLSAGGVWCRRHPRTSHWVKGVPQRHSTVVGLDCLIRGTDACCINLRTAVWPLKVIRVYLSSVISLSSFLTAQGGLQFSPRGLRPSCSLMTARHLDQNTMGYLQWRWGPNSAMTTSLVRDTKSSHFTLALQVWTKHKHK